MAPGTYEVINLGPGHLVRLIAVKRLIELMVAGRAVPKHVAAKESAGISLEQVEYWAYWAEHEKPTPDLSVLTG
jgi:hypothetical protein